MPLPAEAIVNYRNNAAASLFMSEGQFNGAH